MNNNEILNTQENKNDNDISNLYDYTIDSI